MIVSRTPFRISFFGGGTDYPEWYRKHGGAVLSATIDKYCYLTCRYLPPFFAHKYRVVYSKMEQCNRLDELLHPAVREVIRFSGEERGLCITHDGDLPARSGMGSSSSFTVGFLNALYALQGRMVSKHQLAMNSIHIEQEILREAVGSQDQVAAAYGGVNKISFATNGSVSVTPVTIGTQRLSELNDHIMLFYTGIKRTAANIAKSYVENLDQRRRQMRLMEQLLDESIEVLSNGRDLHDFGELMHEGWMAKRSLSKLVSNEEVDGLYDKARKAGAVGGKLTGAGGGGFMLLFVPPERQKKLKKALSDLVHVPFKFEYSGSQIIVCDHEEDFAEVEKTQLRPTARKVRELELEQGVSTETNRPKKRKEKIA
ncbi:MAG: kinase [Myxococcota bacterium]|nr:kinase [Myxococcota bacterium]